MKLRPSLFATLLLASGSIASAQDTNLSIVKSVSKTAPLYGTNVKFYLDVNNLGPDDATGVTVNDLLPDGYEFVSATAGTGTYDEETGVWTIGDLANGAPTALLDITAKVLATGSYQNIASVTGNENDPIPANNSSSVTLLPTWNLYWDGGTADIDPSGNPPNGSSAGGAGTWDNTLKNWDPGTGEPNYLAWDNTPGYTASFGGTAGSVTLGSSVSAGKLVLNGAYTIATGSNTLTLTGSGTTISGNNTIAISGTGAVTLGSSQTWDNTANTMTVSAPVSTGANLLTLNTRDNKLDVTGKISGNGGLTVNSTYTTAIAPSNSGTATLANTNNYTGTTTINGHIWLNSGGLSELGADTSDIILNSGGFRLTGAGTVTRGLSITGSCGISKISGDTTISSKITGTGSFTASANFGVTARVILSAANDHTGATISGPDGTLRLAHVNALQTSTMRWGDNNGRSVFDLAANNLAYNIGGLGNSTLSNSSNNLNLGTGAAGGGNGLVSFGDNDQSNVYVGILSGAAGIKKVGSGTQTLIGDNSYTGNTVISEGILKLGKITGQTAVSCTTGASGANVKRLTGLASTTNLYIGQKVTGSLIPLGARITNINSASQVTLDLGPTSQSTPTTVDFPDILGSVAMSPAIEVQTGATLDVSSFPWTLLGPQTLSGNGTVLGNVTAAGTIAPGASTGTLAFTGDLAITGTLLVETDNAATPKSDAITVTGALDISAATIDFNDIGDDLSGSPHVIATYGSLVGSGFATETDVPAGYMLDYNYNDENKIALVSTGGGTPFQNWATGAPYNLNGDDALAGSDPDGDGLDNIVEFALHGDPTDGSDNGISLGKVQDVSGNPALTLTIATRKNADFGAGSGAPLVSGTIDGVVYTIEGSQDLGTWTTTITEVDPAITTDLPDLTGTDYEYHTFMTPGPVSSTPKEFIRVKVEGQ